MTYPDGTSERFTYDKLDLASYRDREGRTWTYEHDANHRLVKLSHPSGRVVQLGYNGQDRIVSLLDPNGHETTWTYDIQGRAVGKEYADGSQEVYAYEQSISRLRSIVDALNQTKLYGYEADNRLATISYVNAVNATPNVSFVQDPFYPRLASMTDGAGATIYSYVSAALNGALALQQECFVATGETTCSHTISYEYDTLNRLSERKVSGAGPVTLAYDAINRVTRHASDLGAFDISYLGQSQQITKSKLDVPGGNLSTTWSYLNNLGDRRLAAISNKGLAVGQFTDFEFTTTPGNLITGISQNSDASVELPDPPAQTVIYNNLNEIVSVSGQAYSYDANGNLVTNGTRYYTWDAENRLIGVSFASDPTRQVTYAYDGIGRRVSIGDDPGTSGSESRRNFVWCGAELCQARDENYAVERVYAEEGEARVGLPNQPLYYGVDQIGSVRRVFASTSDAPAVDFDPYGNRIQENGPGTDFGFAGMFTADPGGNYLTWYRAYSSSVGRWLSRDPFGESVSSTGNLFVYASLSPLTETDQLGLFSRPSASGPRCFGGSENLPYQPVGSGSPRTGEPWGMWTNGYDTWRFFDGSRNALYDLDKGHHGRGWEYHMWENQVRQPGIQFAPR